MVPSGDQPRQLAVPAIVRGKAEIGGDHGERWVSTLPAVLDRLSTRWSLTLGEPISGATEAYLTPARATDGRDLVLKVCVPSANFDAQVEFLRRADGDGAVQLIAVAQDSRTMLLERLGPSLAESDLPPQRQLQILARLLTRIWAAPASPVLVTTRRSQSRLRGPTGPASARPAGLAQLVTL